jgi:hypothetical protein
MSHYKVLYSIFYSKLVDCIFFKFIEQHIWFVKARGRDMPYRGKETLKYIQAFQKSPRFSLTFS